MTHNAKLDQDYLPKLSDAERWDSPDTFIYQGKLWRVDIHLHVTLVKEVKSDKVVKE
jgi:hypothetical protein